jgi:hypothetical protein
MLLEREPEYSTRGDSHWSALPCLTVRLADGPKLMFDVGVVVAGGLRRSQLLL